MAAAAGAHERHKAGQRGREGAAIIISPVASSHIGAGPAGAPFDLGASLPGASLSLAVGPWTALCEDARAVRTAVFLVEQQIPVEEEWDEWDALSLHAVARDAAGQPVGTGRLLPPAFDADPATGHIGRMAVLKDARKSGVGGAILQALMRQAPSQGYKAIVLHAQKYVSSFYARHGFVAEGDEFLEVGIPHVRMRAVLVTTQPAPQPAAPTGAPA